MKPCREDSTDEMNATNMEIGEWKQINLRNRFYAWNYCFGRNYIF